MGFFISYSCKAAVFIGDSEIYFADNIDGSEPVEGYWGVQADDSTIYIYSDEELTDEIGKIEWDYDEENDVMIIDGQDGTKVAMAQTDASSIEDAAAELEKMATAQKVAESLNNTYWYGEDAEGGKALLAMEGNRIALGIETSDGEQQIYVYYWGLDYDNFTFYDADYNPVAQYPWNTADNKLYLTMDTEEVEFMQIDEETADAEFSALQDSINNPVVAEEDDADADADVDDEDADADAEYDDEDVDADDADAE